ncbi:PREDICTED: citrate lyase subunit beta-like protein, mitochondrial [Branchiostoma belcheri]|uniref:Citramalyl-CoA lyase, mitochondrial n=1 Tax=Branchiostoma belcheri TaxID=7741 RepID=A0A6P4ZZN5_BRABE|nr:PREDICTED: citrate lyase subunit beta-like protein, mitochondrial [Branchiostoma belcheri]
MAAPTKIGRVLSRTFTRVSSSLRPYCTAQEQPPYRPRRALMYVPGNDERKIHKIATLGVDCAVLDCEDGVAANKKDEARATITRMLDEVDFGRTECVVRVNSVDSELADDDLLAILQANNLPSGIMLPKVDSVEELQQFAANLNAAVAEIEANPIFNLITMVESARGLMNLQAVLQEAGNLVDMSPFRLAAVTFGSDDFCADIGASRTSDAKELMYARQKVVVTAKAFGIQAIDLVSIDFKDTESLRRQAEEGAKMGFTGKQVIHPLQVPIVQQAFSPSPERVVWARGLIQAFQQHQQEGKGAFVYEGKMIDKPSLLQAQNVVRLAEAVEPPGPQE